MKVRRSIGWR